MLEKNNMGQQQQGAGGTLTSGGHGLLQESMSSMDSNPSSLLNHTTTTASSLLLKSDSSETELNVEHFLHQNMKSTDVKIAILGIHGSGKSTFFTQCRKIIPIPFSDEYKKFHKHFVIEEIVKAIIEICKKAKELNLESQWSEQEKEHVSNINRIREWEELNDKQAMDHIYHENAAMFAEYIEKVWSMDTVKQCYYEHRHELKIFDGLDYFMNERMNELKDEKYMPNTPDLVHFDKPGDFVEVKFNKSGLHMCLLEIDERVPFKAQICERASMLVFIVNIAAFDVVNQGEYLLVTALKYFKKAVNNPALETKPLIVLLNKIDLLEIKLKDSSFGITKAFPKYLQNVHGVSESVAYIRQQFESSVKQNKQRLLIEECSLTSVEHCGKVLQNIFDALAVNKTQ